MQLFYSSTITPESNTYTLPRDESKHVIRVLRKRIGDIINLTDGKGYLYTSEIEDSNPNKCKLSILSATYQEPRGYELHIAIAPTKLNDRFEWFLEKATEIGVTEFTPLLCDHSERKSIKTERFEKIIQSAMKQSLHYHLPKLNKLTTFSEFLNENSGKNDLFIAHCEDGRKELFQKRIVAGKKITILIGPEGDFSNKEIRTALENKLLPISLGDSRLRTETAGIVACHTVALVNQK